MKLKKIATFLFSLACMVCVGVGVAACNNFGAQTPSTSRGLEYTVNADKTTCTITGVGTWSGTRLVIPESIKGYKVTEIGKQAFCELPYLTDVYFPATITKVGESAFEFTRYLYPQDEIPEFNLHITDLKAWCNVEFVGYDYGGVTGNHNSANPMGLHYKMEGWEAEDPDLYRYKNNFYVNGERITQLVIPDGVTEIKAGAFAGCQSITSVVIPEGVTKIGNEAFFGCYSLKSMTLPASLQSIGFYPQAYNQSLDEVHYQGTAAQWNEIDCDYDIAVGHGRSYSAILYKAKLYVQGQLLTHLTLPSGGMGEAFAYYEYLTSVTIPEGTSAIADNTFNCCTGLKSIVIPDSVISIGEYAFNKCTGLTSIIIPDSVTSISGYAFNNCTGLTSIIIPDSVTSISGYAFNNCTGLTSIIIPDSVTSIGEYAFNNCTGLTSIIIPDSVISIGEDVFYGCDSLIIYCEATSAPSGWGESWRWNGLWLRVVWDCNHNDVAMDGNIYVIIDGIYYGIKDGVVTVVKQSKKIQTAIIPSFITYKNVTYNVTTIGEGAFCDCDSLTSVVIPDSVTTIGGNAFADCDSLTSVIFGNGVTTIGWKAFADCDGLTSIVIPDSVTTIGGYAFAGCDGLMSVTFNDTSTWYYTWDYDNFINKTGGWQIDVTLPSVISNLKGSSYLYKL